MKMTPCGGVMEYGRSCFIFDFAGRTLMVDCGISKSAKTILERYPDFSKRDPAEVDAVFVTHAHEDHTLGLPFAVRLGLNAPVYASGAAIRQTKRYFDLWRRSAEHIGMTIPYEVSHEEMIDFRSLPGSGSLEIFPGLQVSWGLNGHAPGSYWYWFEDTVSLETVFFSGDYSMSSPLLPFEWPPPHSPDLAVMDAAGGSVNTTQESCITDIVRIIEGAVTKGRAVLFHVPLSGKGQDWLYLLHTLTASMGIRLEADELLIEEMEHLLRSGEVRPGPMLSLRQMRFFHWHPGSEAAVTLITDDWLLKNRSKTEADTLVLTTGPVTLPLRKTVNEQGLELIKCPFHVHPVLEETRALITHLQPLDTLFSHADRKTVQALESALTGQGVLKRYG